MKSGNLNLLEPSGPLQACNGTDLPFTFTSLDHGAGLDAVVKRETLVLGVNSDFSVSHPESSYGILLTEVQVQVRAA